MFQEASCTGVDRRKLLCSYEGEVGNVVWVLLQISYAFQQYENFENRLCLVDDTFSCLEKILQDMCHTLKNVSRTITFPDRRFPDKLYEGFAGNLCRR